MLEPLDPKPVRKANFWFRLAVMLMLAYGGVAVILQVLRMLGWWN